MVGNPSFYQIDGDSRHQLVTRKDRIKRCLHARPHFLLVSPPKGVLLASAISTEDRIDQNERPG